MDANEKIIDRFATRVRQMILQYHDVVKENGELYAWLTSATCACGKVRSSKRMCHSFNIVLKAYFDYAINEGTLYKRNRRTCIIVDFTPISSKPQANLPLPWS